MFDFCKKTNLINKQENVYMDYGEEKSKGETAIDIYIMIYSCDNSEWLFGIGCTPLLLKAVLIYIKF